MAGNYISINSKFNPFTYDELIKPVQMYQQAYDTFNQNLQNTVGSQELIKSRMNDEEYQQFINTHGDTNAELQNIVNDFHSNGLSNNSKKALWGLQTKSAAQLDLVNNAYKRKQQYYDNIQTIQMNNPNFIVKPGSININDYMNPDTIKSPFVHNTNEDFEMGKVLGSQLSKINYDSGIDNTKFGNYGYIESYKKQGVTYNDVLDALNGKVTTKSNVASAMLNDMINNAMQKYNTGDYTDEDRAFIRQRIVDGIVSGIDYKYDTSISVNPLVKNSNASSGGAKNPASKGEDEGVDKDELTYNITYKPSKEVQERHENLRNYKFEIDDEYTILNEDDVIGRINQYNAYHKLLDKLKDYNPYIHTSLQDYLTNNLNKSEKELYDFLYTKEENFYIDTLQGAYFVVKPNLENIHKSVTNYLKNITNDDAINTIRNYIGSENKGVFTEDEYNAYRNMYLMDPTNWKESFNVPMLANESFGEDALKDVKSYIEATPVLNEDGKSVYLETLTQEKDRNSDVDYINDINGIYMDVDGFMAGLENPENAYLTILMKNKNGKPGKTYKLPINKLDNKMLNAYNDSVKLYHTLLKTYMDNSKTVKNNFGEFYNGFDILTDKNSTKHIPGLFKILGDLMINFRGNFNTNVSKQLTK